MKKLLFLIPVFLLITAAIPSTAMSNIQYTIKNTTGATITNGIYSLPINPTILATNGFIASNGLNQTIQNQATSAIPFNAGANTGTTYLGYIPSIASGEQITHTLYLGTSGAEILNNFQYFPGTTGIVTPDSALIEPGSDFEFDQSGYFVFDGLGSHTKALVYKQGTFESSSRTNGELTSIIYGTGTTSSQVPVSPDIVNATSFDTFTGAGCASLTTYNCFNNGNTNFIKKNFGGSIATTTLTLDSPNIGLGEIISVVASVDYRNNGGSSATVTIAGNTCAIINDSAWHTCSFQLSGVYSTRPTSVIITAMKTVNTSVDLSNLNVVTSYYPVSTLVTAIGLTSGIQRVQTIADGSNLSIEIDGVQVATTVASTATQDTSNAWNFVNGGSSIYMDYTKELITGVEELQYSYKNIASSTTFPDNAGNVNGIADTVSPTAGLTVTTLPLVITNNSVNSSIISQPDALDVGNASVGETDLSVSSTSGFFLDPLIQAIVSVPLPNGSHIPALLFYYVTGLGFSIAAMMWGFKVSNKSVVWTCLAVVCVGMVYTVIGAFPKWVVLIEVLASIVFIYFDGKAPLKSAG